MMCKSDGAKKCVYLGINTTTDDNIFKIFNEKKKINNIVRALVRNRLCPILFSKIIPTHSYAFS